MMNRRSTNGRRAGSIVDKVEPRIRELLQVYPRMPATVIAERIGWAAFHPGALRRGWAELRPVYLPPDPAFTHGVCGRRDCPVRSVVSRRRDLGRVRSDAHRGPAAGADHDQRLLPLAAGHAAPVAAGPRICSPAGGELIGRLGAVPRALVWDGEGAIGRWRGGRVGADQGMPGIPRCAGHQGASSAGPPTRKPKG